MPNHLICLPVSFPPPPVDGLGAGQPDSPKRTGKPSTKAANARRGKRITVKGIYRDPDTVWTRIVLPRCYQRRYRELQATSGTAVWYHTVKPLVPIHWVVVRDPEGHFAPQAFLSTWLDAAPARIVDWFAQRWQVEVTFAETRAHLGVETQRQ